MKSKIVQIIPAHHVWYSYAHKEGAAVSRADAVALALMDDGSVQPLCIRNNAVVPCIEVKGFKEIGRYAE